MSIPPSEQPSGLETRSFVLQRIIVTLALGMTLGCTRHVGDHPADRDAASMVDLVMKAIEADVARRS